MSVFDEPKIDCHAHVLDPHRFPYNADAAYKPAGQEIGPTSQLVHVLKTFGVKHCLLVQPNSGYGSDNSCMFDAIDSYPKVFKGVAVVDPDAGLEELRALKDRGIVGAAFNATFHGTEYYSRSAGLMERLAELDMFVQIQVEHDQLSAFIPALERTAVRVMIDHCGRPTAGGGLDQPGFLKLLRLADTGRAYVKLSGYNKFAPEGYPFEKAWTYVKALVAAYTLDHCMWASDWPYLRATERQDYGPNLQLVEVLFPDPEDRRKLFWDTPNRLFRFA